MIDRLIEASLRYRFIVVIAALVFIALLTFHRENRSKGIDIGKWS